PTRSRSPTPENPSRRGEGRGRDVAGSARGDAREAVWRPAGRNRTATEADAAGSAGKARVVRKLPPAGRLAGSKFLTGSGARPAGNFRAIAPDFLKLPDGAVAAEKVQIESDQTKKRYLHVVPGT